MSASDREVPPGTCLDDKWIVESALGKGGMGTVYLATHRRTRGRVALKVLHADLAIDPETRARFLSEGRAANLVGHPGAVAVSDDGTTPAGAPYLVMELLEGEPADTLAERMGGTLPIGTVIDLSIGMLEVVAAAHARGIVHRDLKPENLFVLKRGGVKVLDFGLAYVRDPTAHQRLTMTGVPMGTPAFMPPEQALAKWKDVDARSDVYAIGATMWTLLTGRLVHEAETVPEMMVLTTTRQAAPIRTVMPELPEGIANVIDASLAYQRDGRWNHAGAMLSALRRAIGHNVADADDEDDRTRQFVSPRPSDLRTTNAPVATPRQRTELRARWIGLGVTAVAITALGVILYRTSSSPKEVASSSTPQEIVESAVPAAEPSVSVSSAAPPPTVETVATPEPSIAPPAKSQKPRPRTSSVPTAVATSAAPVKTAPPKPNCDPPFSIDARGVKQYKPECLK